MKLSTWIAHLLVPPIEGMHEDDDSLRRRRRRIAFAWTAVLCWAAVIWQLGGDEFSATKTGSFLARLLYALSAELDPKTRTQLLIGIRKSAHFFEYAVLALLAFRAAWISASRNRVATAAWIALFLVATLASADEARQAFSMTRTGSPWDVLLDLTGGSVAIACVLLIARRIRDFATASKSANAEQPG